MTHNRENNSNNRLDRIEELIESNARSIQAMLEQRATDRLEHEERMRIAEERIQFLEETQRQINQTQQGIANLVASLDSDRPTVLRKLNTIENKLDTLIDRQN